MSLRILVDEDSQARRLVGKLRQAGHDVLTINEARLSGSDDSFVLEYARAEERKLLTQNCDDFEALHLANPNHPGIFAVYRDANRSKNMSFDGIVRAIANIEASGIPLSNQFISLNSWNY